MINQLPIPTILKTILLSCLALFVGCTAIEHEIPFIIQPEDERPRMTGSFQDSTMGYGTVKMVDEDTNEVFSGTYQTRNPSAHGMKKRIVKMTGDKGTKLGCEYKFNFKSGHTAAMVAWGGTLGTRMPRYYGTGKCTDNYSRHYSIVVSSFEKDLK